MYVVKEKSQKWGGKASKDILTDSKRCKDINNKK